MKLIVVVLKHFKSFTSTAKGIDKRLNTLGFYVGHPHLLRLLRRRHSVRDESGDVSVVRVDLALNHAAGDDKAQLLVNDQAHTGAGVDGVLVGPAAAEGVRRLVSVHARVDDLPADLGELAAVAHGDGEVAVFGEQGRAQGLEGGAARAGPVRRRRHEHGVVGGELGGVEGEAVVAAAAVDEQLQLGDERVDDLDAATKDGLDGVVALADVQGEVGRAVGGVERQEAGRAGLCDGAPRGHHRDGSRVRVFSGAVELGQRQRGRVVRHHRVQDLGNYVGQPVSGAASRVAFSRSRSHARGEAQR